MRLRSKLATQLLFLALPAFPVLANDRDEIYASSLRCARITDDRLWLDCYYGAAQPMRSHLGLPPAPAAQIKLIPQNVLPNSAATAATPNPLIVVPPPIPQDKSGTFGNLFGDAKPVVSSLRMSNYSFGAGGAFVVTLEDGEVWQQVNLNNIAKWNRPPSTYVISVFPGVLGSFDLRVNGQHGLYKVRRVR